MATLLERIVADLEERRARSKDNGLALADWLAQVGMIPFVGTFEDGLTALVDLSENNQQRLARVLFCTEWVQS